MSDTTQALIEQVNRARTDGTTLEIVGGGSKRFLGREVSADTSIELGGHRGIVNYEPVELVLTARAGTPLRDIQEALAQEGQMLAFEPPHFGSTATLGGTLACNQSGPARPMMFLPNLRPVWSVLVRAVEGRAHRASVGHWGRWRPLLDCFCMRCIAITPPVLGFLAAWIPATGDRE